jgi:hypothetical protein
MLAADDSLVLVAEFGMNRLGVHAMSLLAARNGQSNLTLAPVILALVFPPLDFGQFTYLCFGPGGHPLGRHPVPHYLLYWHCLVQR